MKYKIDLSNDKKNLIGPLVFLGVGVLVGLVFIILSFAFNGKDYEASVGAYSIDEYSYINENGTIMYKYIYTYYVDDKEYTCGNNFSSSKKIETNQRNVSYDPNDPSKCTTDYQSSSNFNIIFGLVGIGVLVIFGGIGCVWLIKDLKKINRKKKLMETGTLIKDVPYEMVPSNVSVNGYPLFKIEANVTLPNGEIIKVESAPRFDKKERDEDGKVDVLVDLNDTSNYFVDFEIK